MKSDIITRMAKQLGLPLVNVKLSNISRADFLGLPVDVSPVSAKTGK